MCLGSGEQAIGDQVVRLAAEGAEGLGVAVRGCDELGAVFFAPFDGGRGVLAVPVGEALQGDRDSPGEDERGEAVDVAIHGWPVCRGLGAGNKHPLRDDMMCADVVGVLSPPPHQPTTGD